MLSAVLIDYLYLVVWLAGWMVCGLGAVAAALYALLLIADTCVRKLYGMRVIMEIAREARRQGRPFFREPREAEEAREQIKGHYGKLHQHADD